MKIKSMDLHFEDGHSETVYKDDTKWLLICFKSGSSKDSQIMRQISLSGDSINDAYLLRILENAVVTVMNRENKIKED